MHLTARHDFAAPPDQVFTMVTSEDFLRQACADIGAKESSVAVEPAAPDARATADQVRTRVAVAVPAPGPLAAFAGDLLRVTQTMTWGAPDAAGARDARLEIAVAGLPVQVAATCRLAPTASGTSISYDGDLHVNVPLVGRTIEKQAAPFVLETIDIQQRSGTAWLAHRA